MKNIHTEASIDLTGLPDAPNHHALVVALEEEIDAAVARALAQVYDDGIRGKSWNVHVPSF